MNKLLELHYIQNFAPSNLNRDDTGAPKDAIFGGYRRARISSQCYKKAMRDYFNKEMESMPAEAKAIRTKKILQYLTDILVNQGVPMENASKLVEHFLGGIGIAFEDKAEKKSQYLLFLGRSEIQGIADTIVKFQSDVRLEEKDDQREKKGKKELKKEAKAAISAEIKKELNDKLDGGKAVDLALFGRMLADLPGKRRDAACQVAHPISTHIVEREFDYYTAVDDLKPDDNPGADMLGTIEFNSACMYRYLAVDLEQLAKNLGGDFDIFYKGIETFLMASALAIPTGKQNSFAAFNYPDYYLSVVRTKTAPQNMANAFEKPISKNEYRDSSLTCASICRFEKYWEKNEKIFGTAGNYTVLNCSDEKTKIKDEMETFDSWVKTTMEKIRKLMEG